MFRQSSDHFYRGVELLLRRSSHDYLFTSIHGLGLRVVRGSGLPYESVVPYMSAFITSVNAEQLNHL